jgi:hypothetical protein
MDASALYRATDVPERTRVRDAIAYVWRREDLLLPMLLMSAMAVFGFNFQFTLAVLVKTVFETGCDRSAC